MSNSCIIGLDVSTSVTGYAVIDALDGSLHELDFIDMRGVEFWASCDVVSQRIMSLSNRHTCTRLCIEQTLQRYNSNRSSSHTLILLAKFNSIVSFICRDTFHVTPEYISSSSARKKCGITIVKPSTPIERRDPHFTKRQIFSQMMLLSDINTLQWPMTRATPKNPNGRHKNECYDMIDAYVVARAAFLGVDVKEI